MIMVGSMLWTPPPGGDAAAYAKSGKSIESETSEEVRRLKHPRMILHTLDRRQKSHAIAHFRHASEFPAPLRDAHDVVRRGRFGLHERHGAPRILGRDDVIAIEDLTRQVAGPLHDHFLGDAGVDEVADARPTEVMRDPADLACGRAGLPPGIQDVPNRLAPAVEDPGHEEGSDRTSLPPALDQLPELDVRLLAVRKNNLSVPDDEIKVTVREGWITLEGEVEWPHQKTAAPRALCDTSSG